MASGALGQHVLQVLPALLALALQLHPLGDVAYDGREKDPDSPAVQLVKESSSGKVLPSLLSPVVRWPAR